MNTAQNSPDRTQTIADGLREVATFLDAHPDVSPQHAFVKLAATNRADLERIAAAFGDYAAERVSYGDVVIEGKFAGGVTAYAGVRVEKLAGAPVKPEYEPILSGPTS